MIRHAAAEPAGRATEPTADRVVASRGPAYLDHAATAPLSHAAEQAWLATQAQLRAQPGNPSALHAGGRAGRRVLEDAREQLAAALGAERSDVVFTSGATEADALGVMASARGRRAADPEVGQIVVSALEHDAVADQAGVAAREGFGWSVLPVGRDGVSSVDAAEVLAGTDLTVDQAVGGSAGFPTAGAGLPPAGLATVSMCLVCAETGVIQPVNQLVAAVRALPGSSANAAIHTDAAQAVGAVPVDFGAMGVDLLTLGGHKVGAPVGTGALLAKRSLRLLTDRPGGGHERKVRSGTVDLAGAAALAAAVSEAVSDLDSRRAHMRLLRGRLIAGLPADVHLTTAADSSPAIAHLGLDTAHPEALLMAMDAAGVMVSAGSACHAGVTRPSEVLLSMGRTEKEALGVLRVSFGPENTAADVDRFLAALPGALATAQALDGRGGGLGRSRVRADRLKASSQAVGR